jgi:hypothetical protein
MGNAQRVQRSFKKQQFEQFEASFLPYNHKYQITQGLIEDYKIRR